MPQATDERYYYQITTKTIEDANLQALNHFKINDEKLLKHEVLGEGSRKFILFGSRQTEYKYSVRPIYKRLLLPFLIKTIELSKLELYVRVSFKEPNLRVAFSGKDIGLLKRNGGELLRAFEQIVRLYLYKRVILHEGIRIHVDAQEGNLNHRYSEEELIALALKAKEDALETQNSIRLKSLNPADRRIIHSYLESDPMVQTASIGDGRFKQIEISLL